MAEHPGTAPHEIRGTLLYTGYDDSPYWAFRKVVQSLGGGEKGIDIGVGGEEWQVSVGYQDTGLEPRVGDDVDEILGYRVNASGAGHRNLPLLIQPRLDWGEERRPQSVPNDLGLGVAVDIQTAVNIEPEEIEYLIPRLLAGVAEYADVGWNGGYLVEKPHDYSTITQYERYWRVHREQAKKIVKTDGIFHRLFQLVADRVGSKVVYSADNQKIIGYNHQLRLDADAASELIPQGSQLGKQLKHYHPQNLQSDEEDPLYHPKIGALFKKGWNDGHAIPWSEHEQVKRELETTLVNLLEWSDITTRCGPQFIADDHFDATPSDLDVPIFEDPTPEIETHQDSVLVSTLSRLSDRDLDVLEDVAMSDGGTTVDDLEAGTGWATSTIYRALQKLDELLEKDSGAVKFVSQKIAKRVRDVVKVTERAVDAQARIVEDVLQIDPRDLERAGRAWSNWLKRYGVEVVENADGEPEKLRIREILAMFKGRPSFEHAHEIVNYGYVAWRDAGLDETEFWNLMVEFENPEGKKITRPAKTLLAEIRDDVLRIPG